MKKKVSIVRCNSYEPRELEASINKAFDLVGGLGLFIKEGDRVLLKPNMLSGSGPEEGKNTHIEVIRACAKLVRRQKATPLIGDNPGGSISAKDAYETTGIANIAREEDIELLEPKSARVISGIPISEYFFECNKIINIPKMKTHSLMTLTGAIKNMYGAVSGLNKSQYHKRFPRPEDFCGVLLDIFEMVKPTLNLMDAIVIMDGNGPAAGRLKKGNILIASSDAIALDSVFSSIVGLDPFKNIITREAHRRGLGEIDPKNIDVVGEKIENVLIKDFDLPTSKIFMNLPKFLLKILTALIRFRLHIDEKNCRRCMVCKDSCPVSCITIDSKNAFIDQAKCITCMCCHELCPYKVVEIRRNLLAKRFGL
ncbi:MAG: DUF362 domain-containing protein [Candidatus Omnitrophota bacterium]